MIRHLPLLAQLARPQELGRRFRGPESQFGWDDLLGLLLFLAVAAGLGWLLRWLLQRQNGIHRFYHPRRLFRELCRAHGLSRPQGKVLWQLAQYLQLEHPATLFLLRELWEPQRLGPEWSPWTETLQELRERLFGVAEPEEPAPGKPSGDRSSQADSAPGPVATEYLTDLPLEVESPTA